MSTFTEKLKNPSVVEAICEFRFAKGVSYSLVPGAMAERLRHKFPKVEELPAASFFAGMPGEVNVPTVPHHRFRCESPSALVQTGPRLLTVNVLPVYPGFDTFRSLISEALEHYRNVAQPGRLLRVGLRYINHFPSPKEMDGINEILNYAVSYPPGLPHPPKELASRLLLSYGPLGTLGLAVAFPAKVGNSATGALLDLDFFWQESQDFDLAQFSKWLNEAHDAIYAAFISIVTEQIMLHLQGEHK